MFHARTGFLVNVMNVEQYTGISFENIFRPNLAFGQPVWVDDSSAPGGHRINASAFRAAPGSVQGNLGRNALSGFGISQIDVALRRDLFVAEKRSLQLRIDGVNAFNHPYLPTRSDSGEPAFGQSPSTLNLMLGTGTPAADWRSLFQTADRDLQISVRFRLPPDA
jgi:hypothetical protein